MTEEEQRAVDQAKSLQASILLNIAMNKFEPVNALAALSVTIGTIAAGMTIGMSDDDRKKTVDSLVAPNGPVATSIRTTVALEMPNVKRFEAAKAAAQTSPDQPQKERQWGDLG